MAYQEWVLWKWRQNLKSQEQDSLGATARDARD